MKNKSMTNTMNKLKMKSDHKLAVTRVDNKNNQYLKNLFLRKNKDCR